jgi:cell division septum initiation protein DivIVA
MNIENYIYYKFNKKTCLYDLIGLNEFSDIVNNELKKYLVDNAKVNTDKRLTDLITKIGNVSKSKKIGESASYKIYDKSFNLDFF